MIERGREGQLRKRERNGDYFTEPLKEKLQERIFEIKRIVDESPNRSQARQQAKTKQTQLRQPSLNRVTNNVPDWWIRKTVGHLRGLCEHSQFGKKTTNVHYGAMKPYILKATGTKDPAKNDSKRWQAPKFQSNCQSKTATLLRGVVLQSSRSPAMLCQSLCELDAWRGLHNSKDVLWYVQILFLCRFIMSRLVRSAFSENNAQCRWWTTFQFSRKNERQAGTRPMTSWRRWWEATT